VNEMNVKMMREKQHCPIEGVVTGAFTAML
jgi:hypothetical protein